MSRRKRKFRRLPDGMTPMDFLPAEQLQALAAQADSCDCPAYSPCEHTRARWMLDRQEGAVSNRLLEVFGDEGPTKSDLADLARALQPADHLEPVRRGGSAAPRGEYHVAVEEMAEQEDARVLGEAGVQPDPEARALVQSAAEATEHFTEDELEEHARRLRERE